MLSDVEIARNCALRPIQEIAQKLNINSNNIELYGRYKAKIAAFEEKSFGKLILVTAMSPTRMGEGKTTVSIGLADGLSRLGKKTCLALREPSLGPVFGIKGGACGGGYSQVVPMEDINLHFTGDLHAISAANNLLSAMIDNHINHGNALGIANVVWKRCMDMNDRALREIKVALGGEKNGIPRTDGFVITAASEIMATLCLSTSLDDLKNRLANIVIGYDISGEEITAGDLKAQDAMAILLKDAMKPNLVQTLEATPAIVHGGPFANIAHGCNSVLATKIALSSSDYAVTEAGFGADLGAEKFFNIKCRTAKLKPNCVVLVVTLRSIKYNAGVERDEITKENLDAVKKGFINVKTHLENLINVFKTRPVVAINKFGFDTQGEIELVKELCQEIGVYAVVNTSFMDGGKGAEKLAERVIEICQGDGNLEFAYDLEDALDQKIQKVAQKVYRASKVVYSDEALIQMKKIKENPKYKNYPICIAKTQFSFSCDENALGCPEGFEFPVRAVEVRAGAGFILVICSNILLMPGLPKVPNSQKMSIDSQGRISGLM
ncbi:MAG: formate--tetrahydrofolate ligase [Bacillota bacterium]|nr:formate--tetrahydrofolate ligase [Bacillota bacterium]HHU43387.1 formate--tetrahydrofolate ligase [Clostridiales bacterium]